MKSNRTSERQVGLWGVGGVVQEDAGQTRDRMERVQG